MGKVSTTKQTGQGGVSYEDKVGAHFLACMLSDTLPFGPDFGLITKVGLQVRQDGWLFDDLLITLQNKHQTIHIGVSVKSNRQFNSNGCPQELNQQLWEQYLHHNTNVFNRDADKLCLIEAPILASVSTDLNTLLKQAANQDSALLHKRISSNDAYSKSIQELYKSFYCPPQLTNLYSIGKEDTGDILKCLLHHEMDFEKLISKDEIQTVSLCRDSLQSKSQEESVRLYKALCLLPRKLSPTGGHIDRKELIQILRTDFNLINKPSHETDWKKISDNTIEKLSLIPDKLGNQIILDRSKNLVALERKLTENKCLVIQGSSGSGKTNLAKQLATTKQETHDVIWIDSSDFDSESIEANLRLTNRVTDLIEEASGRVSYLFMDGIERLYHKHQIVKLATILSKAITEYSSWKIIFTCPSDQLNKVEDFFSGFNFPQFSIGSFDVPELDTEQLLGIALSFPDLHPILFKSSLSRVFNNLKLLDKLARNVKNISLLSSTNNLGESHLIDFIWSEEVESKNKGWQLSQFLKRLAEQQADNLSVGVSVQKFSINELEPAGELKLLGFLRLQHDKLYLNHDLFGDWARYKLIKANTDELADSLKDKDFTSPLWVRAFRLYGISLLEQDASGKLWKDTFDLFNDNSSKHILIQDLLLESFFFAPNSFSLLSLHKSTLCDKDCILLNRLTTLFMVRATKPDPSILAMAKQIGMTDKHASSFYRIPIAEYWPGMLRFLAEKSETVLEFDLINTIRITSLWLEKTSVSFILRNEAANLTLQAAKKILTLQKEEVYVDEKILEPVYKALLLGYPEHPDKVASLCLQICKRTEEDTNSEGSTQDSSDEKKINQLSLSKKSPTWELGPSDRVNDTFRKLCLEGPSLFPILRYNPSLGTEILLAVLIEEPRDIRYGGNRISEHYELLEEYQWYPPFHLRGPFLNFLKISPLEGISFICKLVDFATERWIEKYKPASESLKITVVIDGISHDYYGDFQVFKWHKDVGNVPHTLVTALMATEQFFYERVDDKKDIEELISKILKNTKSMALIGVLFMVGRLKISLFLNELKPFTAEYLFYNWDSHGVYYNLLISQDLPGVWQEQVKKWKERPHRLIAFRDIVLHLILNNQHFREEFLVVRDAWKKQSEELQSAGEFDVLLYQLIHQLNYSNYEIITDQEGTSYQYQEPKEVTEYLATGRKKSIETLQNSQLPHRLETMLDQNLPFDMAGAEYVWNKLQTDYSKIDLESDNHCSGDNAWSSAYTNVLAEIKFLIYNRNEWNDVHPEYSDWIINALEKLTEQQFSWGKEFEDHGTSEDWNIFLAQTAPLLWKVDLKNKVIRRIVSGSVLLFNQKTTKAFFTACTTQFKWNDPNFTQAQNLLLLYAKEHYQDENHENLKDIRNRLSEDFVQDRIQDDIIEWSTIRSAEQWKDKETDSWERKVDYVRRAGLNTFLVIPLMECLPEKIDSEEAHYIFALLEQAFNQVIYQLGEIREESLAIKSYPKDFPRAVLSKIGALILLLDETGAMNKFWEPLFRFGYIAPQYIETFCNSFFASNLDVSTNYRKMSTLLGEMTSYSYSSTTWLVKKVDRYKDFRVSLLGFHPWIVRVWKHDYSAFTFQAEDIYKDWFLRNKLNHNVIDILLEFVTTPSGTFMLDYGIKICTLFFKLGLHLKYQTPQEGRVWVGHPELDEKLSSTLSYLWQYRRDDIRKDKHLYSLYRELIQYLLAIQNIVGIELQNALVEE